MTSDAALQPLRWSEPKPAEQVPLATYAPLLRAAVAAAPQRADLQLQLARTLLQTGRVAELVDRFRSALGIRDADPEILFHLGCGAQRTGDQQLALAALETSVERGYEAACGHLAEALHDAGRFEDALAAGMRGIARSPFDFKAFRAVALVLIERDAFARLWEVCAQLRARGAYGAYVPSAMALAAQTSEQMREVAQLVDRARWFFATELDVPAGFDERLSAELLAHASLAELPATKSTTGTGNRIDQLHLSGGPLTDELLAKIREAVGTYAAARADDVRHPMVEHRPAIVALNAWAVAVRRDGHETWHLHPGGWISGVYYARVPQTASRRDAFPGAIEFGPHPFAGQRSDSPWPRWHVIPRAGTLLLFPSYYGHRTWPTGVDGERVCVAFDVVPRG